MNVKQNGVFWVLAASTQQIDKLAALNLLQIRADGRTNEATKVGSFSATFIHYTIWLRSEGIRARREMDSFQSR